MMPSKTQSILIGALFSTVLGTILAFVMASGGMAAVIAGTCSACLLAFAGPVVAVWHYTRTYRLTLAAGAGAGLGAITGVVGSVLSWAVTFGLRAADLLPSAMELQRRTQEVLGVDASQAPDMSGSFFASPAGELVVGIVAGLIVGAIGGAIAASVFKKGEADDYTV